jgi:hypothetical protein
MSEVDGARACAEALEECADVYAGEPRFDTDRAAEIIRAYRDREVAEALARQVTRIVDLTDDVAEQRARAEASEARVAEQAGEIERLRPIYDAALAWERARQRMFEPGLNVEQHTKELLDRSHEHSRCEKELRALVRAALGAASGREGA